MTNLLVRIIHHIRSASLGGELYRLAKVLAPVVLLLLLCSSCTAITHVDEFEDISPEIKTCMDQEFIKSLSEDCTYCRCTNCDVEIKACGARCREIVVCAILNRCDRGDVSSCVAENCAPLLDRSQVGIDQASSLAVCVSSCNDVCLMQ